MNRYNNLKKELSFWKINKITIKLSFIMKSIATKKWKKILKRLEKS